MNLSIVEIKKILNYTPIENIPSKILEFEEDKRQGVKSLVEGFNKKYKNYLEELDRLESISSFEKEYYSKNYKIIAGIDEVGRGPLAGPVVASIVILPKECKILGINDSKKLSQVKREQLYIEILRNAIDYGIGIVISDEIDKINILQSTYKAMQIAINNLKIKPDCILVDALTIPNINIMQVPIISGDAKSISIGASSIIAKVTRDNLMKNLHKKYPNYEFDKNKGYGSQNHIEAIKQFGITEFHRKTFVKNFL